MIIWYFLKAAFGFYRNASKCDPIVRSQMYKVSTLAYFFSPVLIVMMLVLFNGIENMIVSHMNNASFSSLVNSLFQVTLFLLTVAETLLFMLLLLYAFLFFFFGFNKIGKQEILQVKTMVQEKQISQEDLENIIGQEVNWEELTWIQLRAIEWFADETSNNSIKA